MAKPNPENLKYTKEHEWLLVEGDTVTCGITDHAQELLSDIVFVELPETGRMVKPGDPVAVLESVKSVSDVYSPVSGEITEVNEALEESPDLVNKDAFGEGWIVKMKIGDPSQLDGLLGSAEYDAFIAE